jgi:hypothetical protein
MSNNPLNNISRVYLEQVAVNEAQSLPPMERLKTDRDMFSIPKGERDAARERLLAKAKAKREALKNEEKDPFGRPGGKYGGVPKKGGGYDRGYQAMQKKLKELDKLKKEETEIEEAVKGADPMMRKAAADERKAGDKRLSPSTGKGYADQQKQQISYMDKLTKKNKNVVGLVTKEALDPVGQEDADIDNDGDTDKSDKYLSKRRKAIAKAIDKKTVKEGFSNWREDLSEVVDAVNKKEKEEKITEKTVKNKIKINPNMSEAVENLGGTLLEMVEIDEMDYIIESVYTELLSEGYDEDDIEEALEYSLTEAKVTFGHDTASAPEKKKSSLLSAAKERLSSLKKSAKATVARGARKVAKGALGVARKMEGGSEAPKTAERKPSTYRGAGAGTKEKVSSGSYTAPTKKKSEKPSDPWEGSATTPPKAKTKKATAPKAKTKTTTTAPKRKRKSKLDDLLSSVRSEQVQIDEKILTAAETKEKERIVKSMKDNAADFEKRYPGRGKEVMYATATKMAKKIAEQTLEMQPKAQAQSTQQKPEQQQKKLQQQQDKMRQQEVQILQKKLQALKSAPKGTDPSITAGYELEGELIDELRRSEKMGQGSVQSPLGFRGQNRQRGAAGGRRWESGGQGGAKSERGKSKGESGSQETRLNPKEKSGKYSTMQAKKRGSEMGSRFD